MTGIVRGMRRQLMGRVGVVGPVVVVAVGALLVGCTTAESSGEGGAGSGSAAPSAPPASPTRSPSPAPPRQMIFEYEELESPCLPVSALETLPLATEDPYALIEPFFDGSDTRLLTICTYQRAEIGELGGEDTILEDHVRMSVQMQLFAERYRHRMLASRALPVESEDLDDWSGSPREQRVWWEGCGADTDCDQGEDPTDRTYARQIWFVGHVGNLEFNVTINYIGEVVPRDVDARITAIFRDVVLADIERREWTEPDLPGVVDDPAQAADPLRR